GGHMYEPPGARNRTFECKDKHTNDVDMSLKTYSKWILKMTESGNVEENENVLGHLTSILHMYTNKQRSLVKPVNPLILCMALSINGVDTAKFDDDEIQFTPELAER
ncbi:9014_t:CDS:1, partial [Paraglomus occultum]